MDMTTIVVAASIPSAFTGFCFWLIEQNLKKTTKKRNARNASASWTNANRSERKMSSASSTA